MESDQLRIATAILDVTPKPCPENASIESQINDDSVGSDSGNEFTIIGRLTEQTLNRHIADCVQALISEASSSEETRRPEKMGMGNDNNATSDKEEINIPQKIVVLERTNYEKLVSKVKELEEKGKSVEQENDELKNKLANAQQRISDLEESAKINEILTPSCFLPDGDIPLQIGHLIQNMQQWIISKIETELNEKKFMNQFGYNTSFPEDWRQLLEETAVSLDKDIERMEGISNGMTLMEENVWGKYTSLVSINSSLKKSDGVTLDNVFTEMLRGFQEKKNFVRKILGRIEKVDQYQALERAWKKFGDGILDREIQCLTTTNNSLKLKIKALESQVYILREPSAPSGY